MKKYIANECRGKNQGEMITVEAQTLEEAMEKLGVDEYIKSYGTFSRHYNKVFELYEEGCPEKVLAVIHIAGK